MSSSSPYPFQSVISANLQQETDSSHQHSPSQGNLPAGPAKPPTAHSPFGFNVEDDSLSTQGLLLLNRPKARASTQLVLVWAVLGAGLVICLVLSSTALGLAVHPPPTTTAASTPSPGPSPAPAKLISKIAFGSCSSYDLRPQTIWTQAIIPSSPDAWIWVGDMAYLDDAVVACEIAPSLCNCTLDFIKYTPTMCMAGDYAHGRERMSHQVNSPEYRTFLEFMCPGAEARGVFPPPGHDRSVCPRPILGVYDDHDYGWNNGNRRLPNKDLYKNLFLDALGVASDSPRRNVNRGMQDVVVLNEGVVGREVQVVLLDERYERDTLPCQMRREWCQAQLSRQGVAPDPWCADFLVSDGRTGAGSCCFKDEQLAAWCAQATSPTHPAYRAVCDPTSDVYGSRPVAVQLRGANTSTGGGPGDVPGGANQTWDLFDASADSWQDGKREQAQWRWLTQDSPFCDVLGPTQRQWLAQQLAPKPYIPPPALRLVVSGSVPFGSLGYYSPTMGGMPPVTCSGDDWACYGPAQVNLLHTLANASGPGCVVLLTGDYHYGDIKAVQPNTQQPYGPMLQTQRLARPVYQLMSSGMSASTAQGPRLVCPGTFGEDLVGLRPGGACAYTPLPNFGMVHVDWDKQLVNLEIRNADDGGVAVSRTGQALRLTLSLATCQPV